MKKANFILILLTLTVLFSCNKRFYLQSDKLSLEKMILNQNANKDSLYLSFELKMPPKSVGKKSSSILFPFIKNNADTLKFKPMVLRGENDWDDCSNIPFKAEVIKSYQDSIALQKINLKSSELKFLLSSYVGGNIEKKELFSLKLSQYKMD